MSDGSVQKILDAFNEFKVDVLTELARIQTDRQRDKDENLSRRVRQLEFGVLILAVVVLGKIAGVELPVLGD